MASLLLPGRALPLGPPAGLGVGPLGAASATHGPAALAPAAGGGVYRLGCLSAGHLQVRLALRSGAWVGLPHAWLLGRPQPAHRGSRGILGDRGVARPCLQPSAQPTLRCSLGVGKPRGLCCSPRGLAATRSTIYLYLLLVLFISLLFFMSCLLFFVTLFLRLYSVSLRRPFCVWYGVHTYPLLAFLTLRPKRKIQAVKHAFSRRTRHPSGSTHTGRVAYAGWTTGPPALRHPRRSRDPPGAWRLASPWCRLLTATRLQTLWSAEAAWRCLGP